MAFVREAIFGIAAADDQRHDLVAVLPARDVIAQRDHLAGDFEPGNIGRALGRRIKSLPLHHVGPVDARGGDFHQNLARPGLRHRTFFRDQGISGPPGARMAMAVMSGGKCGMVMRVFDLRRF